MSSQKLIDTAQALVANDKGLLAMDESNPTCNKRFAKLGIPQTEEARRAYREMIVTTPGLGDCISGAILYDETIRQNARDGTPFIKILTDSGIIPGIKVRMPGTKKHGRSSRREAVTRRSGRTARSAQRVCSEWCPICEVAGGAGRGRWHSQPRLHQSERAGAGSIRRDVPGRRPDADRRAGSSHGRRTHHGA